MPRILFLRVSASTYDEKDVPRTWPMLFAAVWPDEDLADIDSARKLARKLAPEREKGVLELARALTEFVRFGEFDDRKKTVLRPFADTLESLHAKLDAALGDRDVKTAETLCTALENTLDEAEAALRGL